MEILDNISKELTEEQLDALYIYLDMNFEDMSDDEKMMWKNLLEKLDKENYED